MAKAGRKEEKMNKNSMLYWFPKIKNFGIRIPKTEIIEIPDFWTFIDNPEKLVPFFPEIKRKAKQLGYPIFMRSDLASGKHDWERIAFMENEKKLISSITSLIDDNLCKDQLCQALVLREYIPMKNLFTAFFAKMPVNPEIRFFVKNGKVLCWHWYWVEDAMYKPSKRNWRSILRKEKKKLAGEELRWLYDAAEKVAKQFKGYWSVDFCKAADDDWVLIDMALGEVSWHPECEKKPKGRKRK